MLQEGDFLKVLNLFHFPLDTSLLELFQSIATDLQEKKTSETAAVSALFHMPTQQNSNT
ncbi:hypothetical protein [Halalkalibacter flavus]|uniref:hypothetical protein n=1 Tax=Halalkalibacter flavus TaxID=3090668 RepID=UPI002FCA37D9